MMPRSNIRRYDQLEAGTPCPLEYAFYLLGDLTGKTIVELGCGDGLNTVILGSLGARVITVDASARRLRITADRIRANGVSQRVRLIRSDAAMIPVDDNRADHVLCSTILSQENPLATARQIRRILKPG